MNNGWIKLHRKIFDNELWFSEPFTRAQAWIDLFANANHKDGSVNIRGNIIKVERGQTAWSELTMAKRWRWSRMKVRRFLRQLESDMQVRQQKLYKLTSITTILNYDTYQNETSDNTTERQQKDNRRDTNKNDKKVKNEKNNYGELENVQLTEGEYTKLNEKYGRSAAYQLVEELSTYIPNAKTAYKDHYATILNWARRKKIVEVTHKKPKVEEETKLTPEQQARNAELRANIRSIIKKV
jgi:hypothetical protein